MTRIKEIRCARGITQKELSERSGVNLRLIQYYEQGVKSLGSAMAINVCRIAKVLDCDVETLIFPEKN